MSVETLRLSFNETGASMFAHRDINTILKRDTAMAASVYDSIWLAAGGIEVCYR